MNIKKFSYVEDRALKSFHEDPFTDEDCDKDTEYTSEGSNQKKDEISSDQNVLYEGGNPSPRSTDRSSPSKRSSKAKA